MMALRVSLTFILLAFVAGSYESSVTADGSVDAGHHKKHHPHQHTTSHMRREHGNQRHHVHHEQSARKAVSFSEQDPSPEPLTTDGSAAPKSKEPLAAVNLSALKPPAGYRYPVINTWACALMCAGHATDGCCSYHGDGKWGGQPPLHGPDGFEDETGICEFRPGNPSRDTGAEGWTQAQCIPGYGTAKCSEWSQGRCVGPEPAQAGSVGLPIWELVWEDHFDSSSCVPDAAGILRPNPEAWSYEYGYKRGKEMQWYTPDNAECKDGALVITAKRERMPWEKPEGPSCKVKNWHAQLDGQELTNVTCEICAPPHFNYYNPCDLLQNDNSGAPACDCSETAEFTSSSIVSRGKKEFQYGLFEMRAKIDSRQGAWSSWWMIGDMEYVPWPKNGEIDILDAFQRMVKGSVIHADESGLPSGAILHGGARSVHRDWEQYYHVWQMEWDKDFITIRIDGQEIHKLDLTIADSKHTSWPNPFHDQKFFMIIDLAVGGHSGGNPEMTQFPAKFQVDYVRVWQKQGRTHR